MEIAEAFLGIHFLGGKVEQFEPQAEALAARPEDVASRLLVDRTRDLRAAPPADWQGIWIFESK